MNCGLLIFVSECLCCPDGDQLRDEPGGLIPLVLIRELLLRTNWFRSQALDGRERRSLATSPFNFF